VCNKEIYQFYQFEEYLILEVLASRLIRGLIFIWNLKKNGYCEILCVLN